MNQFEQELRKLAAVCSVIANPVFAGRACLGDLDGDNRYKLQFVTVGTYEKYEALQVAVLNRKDGEVDSLLIRFDDLWGRNAHIWTCDGKSEWYIYKPTDADFKQLGKAVGGYLEVFMDRSELRQKDQPRESVVKKLRDAKQNPPASKSAPTRKKTGPEL